MDKPQLFAKPHQIAYHQELLPDFLSPDYDVGGLIFGD